MYIVYKFTKIFGIFLINLILLFTLLYLVELFFQIKNDGFFKDNKYSYRQKLKKTTGQNLELAFAPYKFLFHKKKIYPLSGISNVQTLLCKDNENFYSYKSDKFGFNNSDNNKETDLLIIGDSYVHGLCLDQEHNLVNQLNKIGYKAKNLGMMGNGPLLEFATFKEYADEFDYKTLVWVFNTDNDFYDFSNELQSPFLKKYLNKTGYKQDLINKNNLKDNILREFYNYEKRKLKEFFRFYHLDLKFIRDSLQNFIDIYFDNKHTEVNNSYLNNKKNILLITNIFKQINTELNNQNKNLLIIFNAIYPDIMYGNSPEILKIKKLLIRNNELIKKNLKNDNIKFYDFNNFIIDEYESNNIDFIFKKTKNGFDHLSKNGNKLLAEKIIINLEFN